MKKQREEITFSCKSLVAFCIAFWSLLISEKALSQDRGDLKSYGDEGKLYYKFESKEISKKYYILTYQDVGSEDHSGFEGDVRATYSHKDGTYKVEQYEYNVDCTGDNLSAGLSQRNNNPPFFQSVNISPDVRVPKEDEKNLYNLYFALCHKVFQKFK